MSGNIVEGGSEGEAATAVVADLTCRKCRYNLRGLNLEGRCPECGTPVGFSARGDFLRYSEPTWVATLRTGVQCELWSIVVLIAGGILGGVAGAAVGSRMPALVVQLGGNVLALVGAWLLTTPDPSGLGEDRYGTSRKVIRVTLIVGVVGQVVQFAQQTTVQPPTVRLVLDLIGGIARLVGLVGTFATLNYLSKLALRVPDQSLADRARVLMFGVGIPLGVILVVALAMVLLVRGGRPAAGAAPALMGLGCAAMLCGIALIVFGVMYLFMLGRFSTALRQQSEIARQTWAATST
jgi:hypothetical protein